MAPCGEVAGAVASMLCELGFSGVFCAPPPAGFCAEPIVVTQGPFAREARLADGSERGRVDVGAAWPIDVDGVRIASADSDGSGPRGRDGSGRWLWGFTLICTVVRHVG